MSGELPALEGVLDLAGVEGSRGVAGAGEDGADHGQEQSGDALGALEQDAESLLAQALAVVWGEVVVEEVRQLLEAEAGELLAHDDAPPQGGVGLELDAELRQADQEDLDLPGAVEVVLGQGPGFGQGLLGEFMSFILW